MNDEQLVNLTINGRQRSVRAMPTTTLLTVLRDELALNRRKAGLQPGRLRGLYSSRSRPARPQLPVASGEPRGSADHDR